MEGRKDQEGRCLVQMGREVERCGGRRPLRGEMLLLVASLEVVEDRQWVVGVQQWIGVVEDRQRVMEGQQLVGVEGWVQLL